MMGQPSISSVYGRMATIHSTIASSTSKGSMLHGLATRSRASFTRTGSAVQSRKQFAPDKLAALQRRAGEALSIMLGRSAPGQRILQ